MEINVFVCDCDLCRDVLQKVMTFAPESAAVQRRKCGEEGCHVGEEQGVHTVVPSVSIDGEIVHQGELSADQAEELFDDSQLRNRPPSGETKK